MHTMETIFPYIVKVNIALAAFYLLYMVLFRKDTFIRLRRYYFLSAIIFSLAYPLFTVSALGNLIDFTPEPVATEISVYIGEISMGELIIEESANPIDWTIVAKNILLVGILLLSLRFLWQLFSIIHIKSQSVKRSLFGYLFYHLKNEINPFSFFNWIFIHTETHTEKELKQILLHEQTHVRQWHSIDILLVEMLRILFWWNPIVWLIRRDIAINLEYLADKAVLQEGVQTIEYQYHLLQLTNHETAVQIVNNFNVSQLKQRIIMMNRNKTPMRELAKYLSVLPIALLLITANSLYAQQNEPQEQATPPLLQEPQKKESKSDEVFVVVEQQPEFPGGIQGLMEWLATNIQYPEEASKNQIEGRVIVSFVVEKDGNVSDVKLVRGQDPLLDAEATRVIPLMPKWTPGLQRGEKVRVRYTLPIAFRIPPIDTKGSTVIGQRQSTNEDNNEVIVMQGSGSMKEAKPQTLAENHGKDKPLIIVDDVKMDEEFDLNSIKPEDIESISVLKNESALSSYGKEGRNGVIIITLKGNAKITTPKAKIVEKIEDREDVFVVVEKQPEFPGGMQALMEYLADNIKYPVEAQRNGTQGRVITNFVINKNGSITDINIVRGIDPLLDAEAIRVISIMPNWKPGQQRGENVNVRYTLPVVYKLSVKEEANNEDVKELQKKPSIVSRRD